MMLITSLITATIRGPSLVSEADGSVDVCVNVTNANDIPPEGAEIEILVLAQGISPATRKFPQIQSQISNLSNLLY